MDRDRLLFMKEGRARFISHLDLMRTFQRAFLRGEIPIKHTEGFNPHPFVSIALPLSVGFSSRCEILEFGLLPGTNREDVPGRLNRSLPEGITVLQCYEAVRPIRELSYLDYDLVIEPATSPEALMRAWEPLLNRESWVVEKPSQKAKSGSVEIDIAMLVNGYNFTAEQGKVVLRVRLMAQNPGLNPQVLAAALNGAAPEVCPRSISYGRVEVFDRDGRIFR